MDPSQHKRYLDYRDKHVYFGHGVVRVPMLGADAFAKADSERLELEAKGKERTQAEAARYAELQKLLFLD